MRAAGLWLLRGLVIGMGVGLMLVLISPEDLGNTTPPEYLMATPSPVPLITPTPVPRRIGVVAGHWGGGDPGAVCPDGITEAQVNLQVAREVRALLTPYGFQVDVLREFDPRLEGYRALALVSIHADSCKAPPELSGFKVALSAALHTSGTAAQQARARQLKTCIVEWYRETTALRFHAQTITRDMSEYHAFREVDPNTPAVIIETGFLRGDYALLVHHPEVVARGIAQGLLCFARQQGLRVPPLPEPSPTPEASRTPSQES